MAKKSLDALNKELSLLGIDEIKDVDPTPERTEYLKLLANPEWDDKEWRSALKSATERYALAFHTYLAVVYPNLLHEYGEDKVYWNYNEESGCYEELSGVATRGLVIALLLSEGLQARATESFAKDVLARYRAVWRGKGVAFDAFDAITDMFHAQNGWVNVVTGAFEAHTPTLLSRRASAVVYDKEAVCPVYDKFLDEDVQLKKDQVRVIDQFSGLLLTNDIKYQKMLTIIGRPGSGKSTLLDVWSTILSGCATKKKLTELAGDSFRFAGGDLVGRSLCWFDEVDVKRAEMGNTLGELITGLHIRVERKGINGIFHAQNALKCVLTANRLPNSAEQGMYRRMIHIPFNRSFYDEGTQINNIGEKLTEECSGILNRMIRGLHDLRTMRGFTVIEGHDDFIEEYKASSDTIAEFLDTYFEPDAKAEAIATVVLFKSYQQFTGDRYSQSLTPQRFGQMLGSQPLVRFAQTLKKVNMTGHIRGWEGLRLQSDFEWKDDLIYSKREINF